MTISNHCYYGNVYSQCHAKVFFPHPTCYYFSANNAKVYIHFLLKPSILLHLLNIKIQILTSTNADPSNLCLAASLSATDDSLPNVPLSYIRLSFEFPRVA